MPFYCYILYSTELDKFYVGHTSDDLSIRLRKHLTDHSGFTSKAKDWIIVYTESFLTKAAAYQRERQIKNWKSKKMIEALMRKHSSAGSAHPDL